MAASARTRSSRVSYAAVDRSDAAQGHHGDLVRRFLRHAVACHWRIVRQPVADALHAVRPVNPAWAVAPAAQPPNPCLVAGLPRHPRTQRRHRRQPLMSFGAELLHVTRDIDDGKKIKSVKTHFAGNKYGFPLAITVSPTNVHDSKSIVPVLHQLNRQPLQGDSSGRSQLPKPAAVQSRQGAWNHRRAQRRWSRRKLHFRRYSLAGQAPRPSPWNAPTLSSGIGSPLCGGAPSPFPSPSP
jgi:hypothetical protein